MVLPKICAQRSEKIPETLVMDGTVIPGGLFRVGLGQGLALSQPGEPGRHKRK